jgi:hypothetical protein
LNAAIQASLSERNEMLSEEEQLMRIIEESKRNF